ncbi:hypothetical protein SAMN04487897_102537 [Paenibacillus sp. yr247]|nr:hypothetical protein SAMN04487897_102537 [Paenibacillus sp. yr247]
MVKTLERVSLKLNFKFHENPDINRQLSNTFSFIIYKDEFLFIEQG